jgi:hypothetical protein
VVGEHLYIRNLSIFKVLGVEKAILKMTLKKLLTLNNMLHVVDIKIDLIFGSLWRKNSFKFIFESDKYILFKNKMLIGNWCFSDVIFKMSVMTIITMDEKSNNNTSSSHMFESCDMWYDKLNHWNYKSIQICVWYNDVHEKI